MELVIDTEVPITFPDGTKEQYTYSRSHHFVKSFTNRAGIVETYTYDSNGNLTQIVKVVGRPEERTTNYEYDEYGQVTQTSWVGDGETPTVTNSWTYDANGNIATFTDGEGNVEQYQDYDVTGNYHTLIDGNDQTWLLDYDNAGNLTALTNPLGKTTTLAYDGAGNLTTSTLPTTAQTQLAYDARSRLNQVTDALGHATELNIDDTTRTLTVTDALDNTVTMTQNPFDQIKQLVDPTGNVTTLNYNARQLASIDFPTFTQTVEYDSDNRIDTVTNVLDGVGNQTTALTYDVASNLIATLDAEGHGYSYEVDVLDRITTITDPLAGTIDFAYDRRGNLTLVRDPEGRETRFEYNGNDQLIAEVIGTLSQGTPDTTRREYTYDGNGNLTDIITPAGGRISFTYNGAGQLTASNVYANTTIETPEKTISFGRDDIGRLTSYSDATTSATYSYDAVDRVTAVTTNFGPFSKTYSYTYFDNGWIKTYTNPEGITYTYSYHPDGTLAGVHVPGEGQIALTDYKWLAPQTMTLPGGTTVTSNYDALLRLDRYTVTDPAGQTLASGIYSYDRVNNILGIVTEDDTKGYGYDALYRLTSADFDQLDDEAYSYDGVGNRLSSTIDPTWQYNDKNQLVSHGTTTYAYDANGNRIKKTEDGTDTHYRYNTEERLTQVEDHNHNTIASYYYDPFGLRLYKDVTGTRTYFLYNGEGLAAEYDATGNLIAEYHYGPNKPWMTDPLLQRRNGNVYYYQTDHLGTPQKMITKSGQIVWQGQYEAFGKVTETINTVDNPLRFPGQYADDETGTYYNYFRQYSDETGTYIATDPLGIEGGLNRYLYASASPQVFTDSFGLWPVLPDNCTVVVLNSRDQQTTDFEFGDVRTVKFYIVYYKSWNRRKRGSVDKWEVEIKSQRVTRTTRFWTEIDYYVSCIDQCTDEEERIPPGRPFRTNDDFETKSWTDRWTVVDGIGGPPPLEFAPSRGAEERR